MAYGKDKIDEVRKLYVFDRLSLDKASLIAKVAYSTAQRWKNEAKKAGDDWDDFRTAKIMSSGELEDVSQEMMTEFIIEFRSTMKIIKSEDTDAKTRVSLLASLSDSYNKMIAGNKKLMPTVSKLAVAMQTLELFSRYIQHNKPSLLADFVELIDGFGETLDKEMK